MKFIESFKIFESRYIKDVPKEEIYNMLDTVEDIFLELKDIGFDLSYSGTFVNFDITKKYRTIGGMNNCFYQLDGDVFDVVVRICNYLDTIDYMKFNRIVVKSTKRNMNDIGRARGNAEFFTLESFENHAPIDGSISNIIITYDEIRLENS